MAVAVAVADAEAVILCLLLPFKLSTAVVSRELQFAGVFVIGVVDSSLESWLFSFSLAREVLGV